MQVAKNINANELNRDIVIQIVDTRLFGTLDHVIVFKSVKKK